jgi:hypothetical protein
VKCLGHTISNEGISVDPTKVQEVMDWKPPTSVHQIRSFLALCHTRFRKSNQMHPICAPGSSSAHTVDVTSEYPKQCINEKVYNSTLLHDQQS